MREEVVAVRLFGGTGDVVTDAPIREFADEFFVAAANLGAGDPDPFDAELEVFGAAGRYALSGQTNQEKGLTELSAILLTLCVFLGQEVASWAVQGTLTKFWNRLRAPLRRLSGDSSRLVIRVVHRDDQVVVELDAPIVALSDAGLESLMAATYRHAVEATVAGRRCIVVACAIHQSGDPIIIERPLGGAE